VRFHLKKAPFRATSPSSRQLSLRSPLALRDKTSTPVVRQEELVLGNLIHRHRLRFRKHPHDRRCWREGCRESRDRVGRGIARLGDDKCLLRDDCDGLAEKGELRGVARDGDGGKVAERLGGPVKRCGKQGFFEIEDGLVRVSARKSANCPNWSKSGLLRLRGVDH